MYSYCFSAWIFGNTCEIRILYVLLLFFGLDIWKSVRTKDLICIVIVFRLGYLGNLRILYVLLLFFGLDIWKLVRTKHLIRIVNVFRLGIFRKPV